ncbi:MAG TPA: hypothetical protein GX005_08475 [Bacteroidales bacterium]|nr:hypothetical protein [Bacteroidales bacterium]
MIQIAITAGGTEEPIDGIRKITNMSSGSLGWHCLEATLERMHEKGISDFLIHYIKTPRAITKALKEKNKRFVNFINVTNTQSVYDSIELLMNREKIDIFIHAMAISDFAYTYSAPIVDLSEELHKAFSENIDISKKEIETILTNPKSKYNKEGKVSSQKEIIMGFKTTPKVISLIKKMNIDSFLVGFKLIKLDGAEREAKLIEEAEKLRVTNQCDAVFANESSDLSVENHSGLLLHNGEVIARPIGKRQIAESIVNLAIKEALK